MNKSCRQCKTGYEISQDDLAFYDKVSPVIAGKKYPVPPPTLCPDCRRQLRLLFRNERKLYNRKCDLTGKEIISIYSPDSNLKIYNQADWWSDKWDPLAYGREFDFTRPFFEQFEELHKAVPQPHIYNESCENSDYCNYCWGNKDCYLVFAGDRNEGCMYGYIIDSCNQSMDCSLSNHCQYCYECTYCSNCYGSTFSQNCHQTDDVHFSFNLRNCSHCIGCVNLRNKKYCVFNKEVGKDEYEKVKAQAFADRGSILEMSRRAQEFRLTFPHLYALKINCEDSTGDNIKDCNNVRESFDGMKCRDGAWLDNFPGPANDCYDIYAAGFGAELSYMGYSISIKNALFSILIYPTGSNVYYSMSCGKANNLFGCIGVQRKDYCILNRQYDREEYEKLVPKIINHMMKTGEWGEFFPPTLSPFAYNESVANDYVPLGQKEALKLGVRWKDEGASGHYHGPKAVVPAVIEDVNDSITKEILTCDICSRNYRIAIQELKFYRNNHLPVPNNCAECRHKRRIAQRIPRKLFDRACAKCNAPIRTTYAPDRPANTTARLRSGGEIVYCEKCYLKEVY